MNITILELYPIAIAINIWANELSDTCLHIFTDNEAVSYILNSFTSKKNGYGFGKTLGKNLYEI